MFTILEERRVERLGFRNVAPTKVLLSITAIALYSGEVMDGRPSRELMGRDPRLVYTRDISEKIRTK
jgi:hypothetical protein